MSRSHGFINYFLIVLFSCILLAITFAKKSPDPSTVTTLEVSTMIQANNIVPVVPTETALPRSVEVSDRIENIKDQQRRIQICLDTIKK